MRPYLITAKLMRPSDMKRFPTPGFPSPTALVLGLGALHGLQINPSLHGAAGDCLPSPHTQDTTLAIRVTLETGEGHTALTCTEILLTAFRKQEEKI
jgi:hypothetical protein